LPPPSRCADLSALTAVAESPPSEATPLAEELGRAQMLYAAGQTQAGIDLAATVVEQARRVGYRPRVAEALGVHAWGLLERRDHRQGAVEMKEATLIAASS
jgi:hypothetical protein